VTRPATIGDALAHGRRRLSVAHADTPALDVALLVAHVTGQSRAAVLAHPAQPLDDATWRRLADLIERRAAGEPLAYLTGEREFYGLRFEITPAVLVPRPETELLVARAIAALKASSRGPLLAVDVGVGSGAIAVSLAVHVPAATVIGVDVSRDALVVANRNSGVHAVRERVHLVAGSLLDWLGVPVDLIAANLPYLRPDQAHPSTAHEPAIALYSGADGFDLYRLLLRQAPARLRAGGHLLAEIDPGQRQLALACAAEAAPGWPATIERDAAGRDRLLVLTRPG
jgi:release factor glutamine methyltransferase